MKYVKIKAKNYNEALMQLKMEHGDDAIPISHKYVKEGGLFNSKLLAKDVVELTAAIQERKQAAPKPQQERKTGVDFTVGDNDAARKILTSSLLSALNRETPPHVDTYERLAPRAHARVEMPDAAMKAERPAVPDAEEKQPKAETPTPLSQAADGEAMKRFEKEFNEIKNTLHRLLDSQKSDHEKAPAPSGEDDRLLDPYRGILKNNDFDQEDSACIIEEIRNSMSRDDLRDRYKIEKTLKDLLKSRIVTSGPFRMGHKKKIIMFFGPTGVGKTTTMAKLGAIYALRENHSVTFVTIDNYRIAATEQLKKYAEIMKIPVHVINDQKSFKELIDREKSEIIMIDTSGRSHRNELKISEIKSYADMVEYDFEKILCVSANTKKGDIQDVFKAFDKISFSSVIITKVDETSYIGNILDIADKYKKPISYFTNGQEVPNDIVLADPDKLVNMILGTANI